MRSPRCLGEMARGKASLIRLLSGAAQPDEGKLLIDSREISLAEFSVPKAKEIGIRVVHQELSVCTNLNVAENFFLELSQLVGKGSSWRRTAGKLAEDTLATIFPGNRIRATSNVGSLSIAEQQMVEIARAAADPDLKVFILDEPTSSIDATGAQQLMEYLRRRAQEGLCVVFIGHKLGEILDLAEDFLVMRDGRLVWSGERAQTDHESLVALLSAQTPVAEFGTSEVREELAKSAHRPVAWTGPSLVEIVVNGERTPPMVRSNCAGGEIVGLAGLEGSGQQSLLVGSYGASGRGKGGVIRTRKVAYVAGDRRKEGVFPLWATLQNMTVSRHARRGKLKPVSSEEEKLWTEPWRKRFNLSATAAERPILQLSGGNQQKALMSRAMIDNADIILLNDPTRGVDIGVKREFYHVLLDVAAAGKLVVSSSFRGCGILGMFAGPGFSARVDRDGDLRARCYSGSLRQPLCGFGEEEGSPANCQSATRNQKSSGVAGPACRPASDAHGHRPLQPKGSFPIWPRAPFGNGRAPGSRRLRSDVCRRT